MNTIDLSSRLRLVAGLRFEQTHMIAYGPNAASTAVDMKVNGGDYLDALPSASLRIALTKDSGLRLVYGRGVARPNPSDIVQANSPVDNSGTPALVTIANPNLKAEHADNFDVLFEKYLKTGGMFQAGVFYKYLTDPIVNGQSLVSNYKDPQGVSWGETIVSQVLNVGNAHISGFEVGYQQRLSFLPGVMHGLGLSANYSYTNSQANGLQNLLRTDAPALQRQAPNTWNISPTYDTRKFSMRVGMTYNDAMIYAYQYQNLALNSAGVLAPTNPATQPLGAKGPGGDNYLYAHYQLDAQASYKVTRSLQAYAYGLNLNNEVFGFYNGSPQYVVQREYYKPTYAGGLRYNFGER
jgi:TonB-dependent receptor